MAVRSVNVISSAGGKPSFVSPSEMSKKAVVLLPIMGIA
jgi:hypothetical protein